MGQYKTNKDYSEWWIEESYSSGDQEKKKKELERQKGSNLSFFFSGTLTENTRVTHCV